MKRDNLVGMKFGKWKVSFESVREKIRILIKRSTKHGEAPCGKQSREYKAWCRAKERCHDTRSRNRPYYLDRGIAMCAKWANSFEAFLADMGRCPKGYSLDRFPDNDGNYKPGNCRWATAKQQANNRRKRKIFSRKN